MSDTVGITIGAEMLAATRYGPDSSVVAVPAVVAVEPGGRTLLGADTAQRAAVDASSVYRNFVDRIVDAVPVRAANGHGIPGAELLAMAVLALLDRLRVETPTGVVLARPVWWGNFADAQMRSRLAHAGLTTVRAAPRAVAAANGEQNGPTGSVVVVDVDSWMTEVSLVGAASPVQRVLETTPVSEFGAYGMDRLLARHVLSQMRAPLDRSARRELRTVCSRAREDLEGRTATTVTISGSRAERVRVVRAEFESLIARRLCK